MRMMLSLLCAGLMTSCAGAGAVRAPVLDRAAHFAPGQTEELRSWLGANIDAAAQVRAAVYAQLCDAESRVGHYRAAAAACTESQSLMGENASEGLRRSIAFWSALASVPPIEAEGAIDAELGRDWTGMATLEIAVGEVSTHWGVDTGAEVSLLRVSEAQRMGVRMLNQQVDVAGSTPGAASGGLGVIDRMTIGAALVRHVPVMVVPDESMSVEGRFVPPILGMPIFYSFGVLEFSGHGARLRTRASISASERGAIAWNASGISIPLRIGDHTARLHLDTGANATEFDRALITALSPAQRRDLVRTDMAVVGVSGAVERETLQLPHLTVGAGNASCELAQVVFGEDEADVQGRAGIDLVRACDTLLLDFTTMSLGAR